MGGEIAICTHTRVNQQHARGRVEPYAVPHGGGLAAVGRAEPLPRKARREGVRRVCEEGR